DRVLRDSEYIASPSSLEAFIVRYHATPAPTLRAVPAETDVIEPAGDGTPGPASIAKESAATSALPASAERDRDAQAPLTAEGDAAAEWLPAIAEAEAAHPPAAVVTKWDWKSK